MELIYIYILRVIFLLPDNPMEIYLGQILIKAFPTNDVPNPRANAPTPGSADICLVIRTDLTSATQYLQVNGTALLYLL